jgi:hypothetical protein
MESKARKAVLFGANQALRFFQDDRFRELINFAKHDEEEQNRFFNELTVTNLILLMLLVDQSIKEVSNEDKKEYLKALREAVPKYFKTFIGRIGIPKEFATIWNKLIDLRYDEYVNETNEVRAAFLGQKNKELQEYAMDYRLMIFQSIALGLYSHLMRGKIKPGDSLYKYIQPYLLGVYEGYLKRI